MEGISAGQVRHDQELLPDNRHLDTSVEMIQIWIGHFFYTFPAAITGDHYFIGAELVLALQVALQVVGAF